LGLKRIETILIDTQEDDESVGHLIELGYVDPDVVRARDAGLRQQLDADLQKARLLYKQGDLKESERLLTQLVRDDAGWASPHQLLAQLYYQTGRTDDAQSQLDWLVEHAVEHPSLALISAAMALSRREFASALDQLHYARHYEPDLAAIDTLIGTSHLRLSQLDQADESFRKAIEHDPNDARAHDGLAAIELRRGQFEQAASSALEALENDIRLYTAHCHLGLALMHLGRPQEAIAAFETAAKINPTRVAPYYWLSRIVREQLGDRDRAAKYEATGRAVIRQRRSTSAAVGLSGNAPSIT
jgi:tetratricopeptide (TPR) repeat protein